MIGEGVVRASGFPGQFLHLLRRRSADPAHQVVFIAQHVGNDMPGVVKVPYVVAPTSARTHLDPRDFDTALRRARAVAEVGAGLRSAGFAPYIIIGHESWGEMLISVTAGAARR